MSRDFLIAGGAIGGMVWIGGWWLSGVPFPDERSFALLEWSFFFCLFVCVGGAFGGMASISDWARDRRKAKQNE